MGRILRGCWYTATILLALLGLGGVPDDVKAWAMWLSVFDAYWVRVTFAIVGVGGIVALYERKRIERVWARLRRALNRPNSQSFRQFDTPILSAINHLINTAPHSYTRSDWAEREAFVALYEKMCSGQLAVIGKKSDFTAPSRISASECRALEPREVVVARTASAPDGARFSLCSPHTDQEDKQLELCDLRVCSDELYRIWPKVPRLNLSSMGENNGSHAQFLVQVETTYQALHEWRKRFPNHIVTPQVALVPFDRELNAELEDIKSEVNLVRAKLKKRGYDVPPRCTGSLESIKTWHRLLGAIREHHVEP